MADRPGSAAGSPWSGQCPGEPAAARALGLSLPAQPTLKAVTTSCHVDVYHCSKCLDVFFEFLTDHVFKNLLFRNCAKIGFPICFQLVDQILLTKRNVKIEKSIFRILRRRQFLRKKPASV